MSLCRIVPGDDGVKKYQLLRLKSPIYPDPLGDSVTGEIRHHNIKKNDIKIEFMCNLNFPFSGGSPVQFLPEVLVPLSDSGYRKLRLCPTKPFAVTFLHGTYCTKCAKAQRSVDAGTAGGRYPQKASTS